MQNCTYIFFKSIAKAASCKNARMHKKKQKCNKKVYKYKVHAFLLVSLLVPVVKTKVAKKSTVYQQSNKNIYKKSSIII